MHPPLEAQRRADGERARLLRHSAPRDARQIVRPSIAPVHREDQVADLAPERRTAVVRGLAQRAPELDAVAGYAAAALERLGITAAFGDRADFSNLSRTPAYVSSVAQESHIGLDENGVEASAYTKVDIMEMSALPDPSVIGELELNLNRPFLYEIRTRQGIPLFIGVCTQPDEAA